MLIISFLDTSIIPGNEPHNPTSSTNMPNVLFLSRRRRALISTDGAVNRSGGRLLERSTDLKSIRIMEVAKLVIRMLISITV